MNHVGHVCAAPACAGTVAEGGENYCPMQGIIRLRLETMSCQRCQGAILDARTAARPGELYLQDRAGGYRTGLVHGTFTLEKKLDDTGEIQ